MADKYRGQKRHDAVLEEIVNSYIDTAEPVGSRVIARKMGLSSATIRNVMQDLEEDGYISQPHTSAGRVPTEKGYRYYVDSLMHIRKLTESQEGAIDAEYKFRMKSLNDILAKTSHILSKITKCAGVVLLPRRAHSHFKHIYLIPITQFKVLVFLVTETGVTKDFIITTDYEISRDALERIANFLNNALYDMTLAQIKAHLAAKFRAERDSSYRIIEQAKSIIDNIVVSQSEPRLYIDGTSQMLKQPEFNDLRKMKAILEFLEEKENLLDIFSDDMRGLGTVIHIGHENRSRDLCDMSVVTRGYRIRDDCIGRLGVIGPTRMCYDRIVPLVNFMADTLTDFLSEAEE